MNLHPHLYLYPMETGGFCSLPALRRRIGQGRSRQWWEAILRHADSCRVLPPWTPATPLPGRSEESLRHANRDARLIVAVGNRLLNSALAFLLTDKRDYLDSVWRQIEVLFDPRYWPDWRDLAPSHQAMPADLRTGYLGKMIAITYDWIEPVLPSADRSSLLQGLRDRAFNPFWQAVEQRVGWVNGRTNWMTCIVGGLGIAAMALEGEVERMEELQQFSLERMVRYLGEYGPEGEFNESPGYSTAMRFPVEYFLARRYHTGGADDALTRHPFPAFCRWLRHVTLPSGFLVPFGDTSLHNRSLSSFLFAIAQATRDPVIQWQALRAVERTPPDEEPSAFDLLWFDESLPAQPPPADEPLGRLFPAHSAIVASRSSWQEPDAIAVVGKGGHGQEAHGHHDAGTLCLGAGGELLITEPGIIPSYPNDFFGPNRYAYYNASVQGHNVLQFGDQEMRTGSQFRARFLEACFDNRRGAVWQVDTTALYENVHSVRRTVVHLLPGIVAVLDEARLSNTVLLALRWHIADPGDAPNPAGFSIRSSRAALAFQFADLEDKPVEMELRRHRYSPPFDRSRLGDPLPQKNEPFVEIRRPDDRCRWLTLFSVRTNRSDSARWQRDSRNRWSIETPHGIAKVAVLNRRLTVNYEGASAQGWDLTLSPP